VNRITEELEFQPGLLEFLEESALMPGNRGVVTAASPDGTVTVEVSGTRVGVGSFAAERILVTD
jgi:DtxR family Mn-dependent transcriptional regulator